MKLITEYLSTKVVQTEIKATDETIHQIVKDELGRLGNDADLNHIDVSEVTNMKGLFRCDDYGELWPNVRNLNPDISRWNVRKVETMKFMFAFNENFNKDISGWDVSNVKDMDHMFYAAKKFNQDLSEWDVSSVKSMFLMFGYCENFNQDLSKWDVRNVKRSYDMFHNCPIKEKFKPKFKK